MTKITIFLLTILVFSTTYAQQNLPDKRLKECFSSYEISELTSSNPELIEYYNFYMNNSYYVVDLKKAEKEVTGIDIHTVSSRLSNQQTQGFFELKTYSKETFNPLAYNFNLKKDEYVVYVWKDAGVAIVFYPLSQISMKFKQNHKAENK